METKELVKLRPYRWSPCESPLEGSRGKVLPSLGPQASQPLCYPHLGLKDSLWGGGCPVYGMMPASSLASVFSLSHDNQSVSKHGQMGGGQLRPLSYAHPQVIFYHLLNMHLGL